jgi:predicted NBD/HSP70 family sugar kinase
MFSRHEIAQELVRLILHKGETTRPTVLDRLDVRPALLYEVVSELSKKGLVCEPLRTGRNTGRRASPITFNARYGLFLGVELDIRAVTAVCIDTQGNVIQRSRSLIKDELDAANARRHVSAVLHRLLEGLGADAKLVRGAGFADPGLVDISRGVSIQAVNIPGWENLSTAEWLHGDLRAPWLVVPGPMTRAHAEYVAAGYPANHGLFHMQLDEGIGGGFIKNGTIYTGDTNCAMEVGHVVVQEGGPMCRCGNRGCLEAVAGLSGLAGRVAELARHDVHSTLTSEPFSLTQLVACVKSGDKAARSLANDIGEALGTGLAALICVLNPRTVVFSGALSGLGQPLLDIVSRTLSLRCLPQAVRNLDLKLSQLGEDGAALGAALLTRQSFAFAAVRDATPTGRLLPVTGADGRTL